MISAGVPLVLAPGGMHIMLTGLTHQLVEGGVFPLTVLLGAGGSHTVEVQVSTNPPGGA